MNPLNQAIFAAGLALAFVASMLPLYDLRHSNADPPSSALAALSSALIWWSGLGFPPLRELSTSMYHPADALEYSLASLIPVVGLLDPTTLRSRPRLRMALVVPLLVLALCSLLDAGAFAEVVTGRLYGVGIVFVGYYWCSVPLYENTVATMVMVPVAGACSFVLAILAAVAGNGPMFRKCLASTMILLASSATRDVEWLL